MNNRQTLGKLITGQPNKPVDLNTYQICGEDFINNTLVISIYDLAVFLEDGWTLAARFTKSQKEAVRKFLKEQSDDETDDEDFVLDFSFEMGGRTVGNNKVHMIGHKKNGDMVIKSQKI